LNLLQPQIYSAARRLLNYSIGARDGVLSLVAQHCFFYYKLAGRQMVNVNQILLAVSAPRK
jgi:hypothetical protein